MRIKLTHILLIIVVLLSTFISSTLAQQKGQILVLTAEGPVSVTMLGYIERGIATAEAQQAELLIIQLNTPGGQIDLTREIIQAIVNSKVPVAVYVYPSGGFAASAGTFITLAGHVAAMAPQTSIGAASPVNSDGGDIDETMKSKVENILIADIENLAERRGEEALEWATKAVTEAEAANANEAMELGIIDFIAKDTPDLIAQLHGFEVDVRGETKTLSTLNVPVVNFEMTVVEKMLSILLQPEIAFMLLSLGSLAIFYEITSPGGYIGGVIGLILVILGLYAIGQLPINYAGVGLLVLAVILFVAEVFAPTHGALTLTGAVCLTLGGLLLFDEAELGYQVSSGQIIATGVAISIFFFFIAGAAVATLTLKPATGMESLIGTIAIAKTPLNPSGSVLADGTRWHATLQNTDVTADVGQELEIIATQGLKLTVRHKPNSEQ